MVQRGQSKSGEYTVMSVDVVWTAEFAANGWLRGTARRQVPHHRLPEGGGRLGHVLQQAVRDAVTSDGALLYYRKDLLDKANVKPPTTWDEMQAACDKVLPGQSGMSCYGGQFQKYEGLTCNFAEAVNSCRWRHPGRRGQAGGQQPGGPGRPAWMVDGFKTGMIPKEAITWKEEESRTGLRGQQDPLPAQLALRVEPGQQGQQQDQGQVRRCPAARQ